MKKIVNYKVVDLFYYYNFCLDHFSIQSYKLKKKLILNHFY
jgi:hypothetical protein